MEQQQQQQLNAASLPDIYHRVAAEIFNVPEAQVTTKQREAAKEACLTALFDVKPSALAVKLGISHEEAHGMIECASRIITGEFEKLCT